VNVVNEEDAAGLPAANDGKWALHWRLNALLLVLMFRGAMQCRKVMTGEEARKILAGLAQELEGPAGKLFIRDP
jgi:hypothetical protein